MSTVCNCATDKQIDFILRLCGGTHESHAFSKIARDMKVSPTAARSRATKADATKTIERLKAARGGSASS